MAASATWKLGEHGKVLRTDTDANDPKPFRKDGVGIDLTVGGYVSEVRLWGPGLNAADPPTRTVTTGVVGAADGHVVYTTNSGDFDIAGEWRVVFWVTGGAEGDHAAKDFSVTVKAS